MVIVLEWGSGEDNQRRDYWKNYLRKNQNVSNDYLEMLPSAALVQVCVLCTDNNWSIYMSNAKMYKSVVSMIPSGIALIVQPFQLYEVVLVQMHLRPVDFVNPHVSNRPRRQPCSQSLPSVSLLPFLMQLFWPQRVDKLLHLGNYACENMAFAR